jgi:hypothetical protein
MNVRIVFAAGIAIGLLAGAPAHAQPAPAASQHLIPQSIRLTHARTREYLATLGRRPGQIGIEAKKLLAVFEQHMAKEEAFILPPLILLPALARGEISPDMAWAIPMSERVKAEQAEIFRTHSLVVEQAIALQGAAEQAGDPGTMAWVRSAIIDDLGDLELMENMSILVGDMLRAKLQPK